MNRLDEAADRLRGRWIQGGLRDDDGNVCLLGALYAVGSRPANSLEFRVVLDEAGCNSLAHFNDDPTTTEEDILLLLKKASARLDEMQAGL